MSHDIHWYPQAIGKRPGVYNHGVEENHRGVQLRTAIGVTMMAALITRQGILDPPATLATKALVYADALLAEAITD